MSARQLIGEMLAVIFTPRPQPDPDLWCDEHRVIPAGAAERPGRWDTARTPYFREPFRVFLDPDVRQITMLKSAQLGASEWGIGLILYTLAVQNNNAIVVYPREEEARKFLVKRIRPAIELCRAFDDLRTGRAHDEKTTEIALKSAGLSIKWAHAGGGVKSDPCPKVFADEADDYPPGVTDQLESRTLTFSEAKVCAWSTPSLEGIGIDALYAQSDQRRYMVPCPYSGRFFELYDLSAIRWEGGLAATPEEAERTAHVQSPFVEGREGRIYERSKPWMIANGVWVRDGETVDGTLEPQSTQSGTEEGIEQKQGTALCDSVPSVVKALSSIPGDVLRREGYAGVRIGGEAARPDSRHVGFRLNSLISPWVTWGKLASEFVQRRGNPNIKWINDRLGQAWRAKGSRVDVKELAALIRPVSQGGYRLGTVPSGCLVLVTCVDVQADHTWVGTLGFGEGARDIYWIDNRRIEAPEGKELAELDILHAQQYDMLGVKMRPVVIGMDYGHRAKEVRRFESRASAMRRKVAMIKGEGTTQRHWLVKMGQTEVGTPLVIANTNSLKDWAASLMNPELHVKSSVDAEIVPGRLHLPEDISQEVLLQLTAEERANEDAKGKTLRRGGVAITEWRLRPGRRDNHYFDVFVMALALGEMYGFEGLSEEYVHKAKVGQGVGGIKGR